MKRALIMGLLLLLPARAADAGLSLAALESVRATPPANARIDLSLAARDVTGKFRPLGEILAGRPGFISFVDYTCNTLCGTDLMLLADGLRRADISPSQYRIVVLGIDPKDSPQSALAMEHAELPPSLWPATVLLLPDKNTVAQATAALGFHYVYDAAIDQFAHPAVVYAVGPDGRLRATLSPMKLLASDLRQAISSPSSSPSLYQRIRLLCYAYDPVTGLYTARIDFLLKIAAAASLILLAAFVLLVRRRRPAS